MLQRAVLGETDDSNCQMAVSYPARGPRDTADTDSDYQRVSDDQADCSLTDQMISSTGQDSRDAGSAANEMVQSNAEVAALMDLKDQPIQTALQDSSTVLGGSLSEDEV